VHIGLYFVSKQVRNYIVQFVPSCIQDTLVSSEEIFFLALEVCNNVYANKDEWESLFKPSDFFQKYK
jgi:poly(A) polymerase Pap1